MRWNGGEVSVGCVQRRSDVQDGLSVVSITSDAVTPYCTYTGIDHEECDDYASLTRRTRKQAAMVTRFVFWIYTAIT